MKSSSNVEDDEDLETRLIHKRKAAQASGPKVLPTPRNIRLRLRSASGQKTFPVVKATSELPPIGAKGSLSKHLRSSSLISEPLLGSSKAPIEIPTAPSSSRVRDKTPEISAARITPAFDASPLHATGISKPSHPEGLVSQSPLASLFADALPAPYVPKSKITPSTVVGSPETAWGFLAHIVPLSHKFMSSTLRSDLFDDQYSISLCEGFFRGAGMLQRMDEVRRENEGLKADLKTSQTIAAELRCRVTDAEWKLLEEKGAGAMLEQRERVWERERMAWVEEKEELVAELKRQKELDSVSQGDLDTMAYRDVGYQPGLKDGYAYSAQGLGRKETPLYNSKKQLSKLDKEFGEKTHVLLEKILERPLMSIDELKALLTPAGSSSPKSLSGDAS
ncbi:hypothetical protein HanPI659440_Chr07g0252601 [Helianthus annuus]|nr:hypothetical protein HanPI659440_Chr07g0252601 [Helianthus annuus]